MTISTERQGEQQPRANELTGYPNDLVIGCKFGSNHPHSWADKDLPRWLRRGAAPLTVGAPRRGKVGARDLLKALTIAICATLLGLALPAFDTLDYWVGMAAFLVAMLVAATL